LFEEAARQAEALDCIGDDVYPAEYRRELAGVLVGRALVAALADAGSSLHA
jgi:hypothetical protein